MGLLSWLSLKPGELMPGITRPTTTVAHLLVAEMLSNLDHKVASFGGHLGSTIHTIVFPSFTVKIRHFPSAKPPVRYEVMEQDCEFPVKFDKNELDIILQGFIKFDKLRQERAAAKKETDNQEKAVNFIANMMKTKPEDIRNGHARNQVY